VAVIGLAVDLWTKHWAFSVLGPDESRTIIPYVMSFRRSLNSGALFGMGKGLTPLFIVASLLALGFVFYLFAHSHRARKSLHVALAMVLGGALGNLYDRTHVLADVVKYSMNGHTYTAIGLIKDQTPDGMIILGAFPESDHEIMRLYPRHTPTIKQQGVVRDFIKMEPKTPWFDWWPWVFNIADSLLVVGVALLMLNFWWDRKTEQAAMKAAAEAGTAGPSR
jgi:signal peptidase II